MGSSSKNGHKEDTLPLVIVNIDDAKDPNNRTQEISDSNIASIRPIVEKPVRHIPVSEVVTPSRGGPPPPPLPDQSAKSLAGQSMSDSLTMKRPPRRYVTWGMALALFVAFGLGFLVRQIFITKCQQCPPPVTMQPSALQALDIKKKPVPAATQKPERNQKRPAVATPPAGFQRPTKVELE